MADEKKSQTTGLSVEIDKMMKDCHNSHDISLLLFHRCFISEFWH